MRYLLLPLLLAICAGCERDFPIAPVVQHQAVHRPAIAEKPAPKPREGYFGIYAWDMDTLQIIKSGQVEVWCESECIMAVPLDSQGVAWFHESLSQIKHCTFAIDCPGYMRIAGGLRFDVGEVRRIVTWRRCS